MLKLSTYFRSTAAYRVRIALQLKDLPHDLLAVSLIKDGGQHRLPEFLEKNPNGLVPVLETDEGIITQSIAILEYLEESYPDPSLLPVKAIDRAYVRAISQTIACDIHPLNNLRVLQYLKGPLAIDDGAKDAWYRNWIAKGFSAIEKTLTSSNSTGNCCFGDEPTIADCCLIPQIYNANRFNCPMEDYPTILKINEHCLKMPAFVRAHPDNQADAN